MRNFKDETLEELKKHGKTPEDIVWIGLGDYRISIDDFWQFIDYEYEPRDNWREIDAHLLIVGDGWWLERNSEEILDNYGEYDGYVVLWNYIEIPTIPEKIEKADVALRKLMED